MPGFDSAFPSARRYRLRRARIPGPFLAAGLPPGAAPDAEGCVLLDLLVDEGRVAAVAVASAEADAVDTSGDPAVDLGGRQLWPTLVDMHAHLDKAHTVARTPNADGTFAGALDATRRDRIGFWTADDIHRRMDFALRCAEAHGVGAIRTHLDSPDDGPHRDQAATTWGVFRAMREAWAGRVVLQGVGLVPIDAYATDHGRRLADIVAASGGLVGGALRPTDPSPAAAATMAAHLEVLFGLARERDLDIDLHVDEVDDPWAASLDAIARATLRFGYEGRVTCGHCCSLALQPPERAGETIARVATAGITIVTLPTVNMYLQDRHRGRTPRWRGVTPVHELIAAGVRVAAGGDNCRDGFYAYGDHDALDTMRQAVRILHFDHPLDGAPALVGPAPAAAMKLEHAGTIRIGAPADFILLQASTLNEVVTRPQSDRIVINRGRPLAATVPSYPL